MTFPKSNEYNKITSLERYFCSYQAKTQDSNSVINNIISNLQQQINCLKINNKKMQEKIEQNEKKNTCCICLENKYNIAFINCGHACICEGCAINLQERANDNILDCPICRTNGPLIKIYFN